MERQARMGQRVGRTGDGQTRRQDSAVEDKGSNENEYASGVTLEKFQD